MLDKKALSSLIDQCYRASRNKATVLMADRLRTMGYEMSTRAGISICMDDMVIPDTKQVVLKQAEADVSAEDGVDLMTARSACRSTRTK